VARTKDLGKVRDAFLDTLGDGERAWDDANSGARRKTVAEDIFLRFAVGRENFTFRNSRSHRRSRSSGSASSTRQSAASTSSERSRSTPSV